MDGYSEIGAIYFAIQDKTSYARFENGKIKRASYKGLPPYKSIEGKMPNLLKQYHAAEHQVYNAFMSKIKKTDRDAKLEDLAQNVPSIEEAEKAEPFSLFCGTTIILISGLALLLSAIPNIFKFHNQELVFMSIWMASSLALACAVGAWVQRRYFLAKPKRHQLKLGIEALKEVLKNEPISDELL